MLTKCLVTPLKMAKHLEWNSRLGKLGSIMCIDISNHQIGIAFAYRRQQPPATRLQPDDDGMFPASSTTTITPLPPLPYISNEAYHGSYAFLHHNRYDCRFKCEIHSRLTHQDSHTTRTSAQGKRDVVLTDSTDHSRLQTSLLRLLANEGRMECWSGGRVI